ncbi:glycosyltransferase [Vibrio splendidus]
MIKLSSYIICKNEEASIKDAVMSLLHHVEEIIIVDTGSTDRTINIVKEINTSKIKVFEIEWRDDFAAARNFALEKVNYNWVVTIDADEVLKEPCQLKEMIASLPEDINAIYPSIVSVGEEEEKGYSIPRIFKKDEFYYHGVVHEQLTPLKSKEPYFSELEILHYGYENDTIIKKQKLMRNFHLSLENHRKDASDEFFMMYLVIDWAAYPNSEHYVSAQKLVPYLGKITNMKYFEKAICALFDRYTTDLDTLVTLLRALDPENRMKAIQCFEVPMTKFSTCVMTDTFSQRMKETVSSVIDDSDEVVILATNPKIYDDLCRHYTNSKVNVYYKAWGSNFAKMRNHLSSLCSNDVVFHIDSDESVGCSSFFQELAELMLSNDVDTNIFEVTVEDEGGSVASNISRIFNRRYFSYVGYVHELVKPINDSRTFSYVSINSPILHSGYSLDQMKAKLKRNTALNKKNLELSSSDFRWVYFSIKESCQAGNYQDATEFIEQVKNHENQNDEYISDCYCYLLFSLIYLSRYVEAKSLLTTAKLELCDRQYFQALLVLSELEACKKSIKEITSNITDIRDSKVDITGFHIDVLTAKVEIMNQDFCTAFDLFEKHGSRGDVMSSLLESKLVRGLEY